ncbi:MAG: hypothetical protein ACU0CO_10365 [Shimia sp.]
MSMTDLNNAAAAQNALTARINAFLDTIDADIASRQAAYTALAANLTGIVTAQMHFSATIDPDEAAPTEVDGGTFNTVADAINAAPASALVFVNLIAGKTHPLGETVNLHNRSVFINKSGAGANPVLAPVAWSSTNHNFFHGFGQSVGGRLLIAGTDIALPAKDDPALPWAQGRSLIAYQTPGSANISVNGGTISGDDGQALLSGFLATQCRASLYNCTFDGPIFAVRDLSTSVSTIARASVTLANGAALTSDGTAVPGNYVHS